MPFRERLEKTAVIVRGKAGKTISTKLDGPDGPVVSLTDIELTEVLKGDVGAKALQVSQPGGEFRGQITHVEGAAKFTQDQDVVLFLAPGDRGIYLIPSLELGQYTVVIDNQGREVLNGIGYPEGEKPWTLAEARAALTGGKKSESRSGTPGAANGGSLADRGGSNSVVSSSESTPASTGSGTGSPYGVILLILIIGVAIAWWMTGKATKPPRSGGGSS